MSYFMGIDIGSGSSKGVITEDNNVIASYQLLSGVDYRKVSQKLVEALFSETGLSFDDISNTVATGQGAASVSYSNQDVTDIRCCAKGINYLFPSVRTVIDVQGQSTQVIRIDESGLVGNFVISEKCASGSGRFLDIISNVLQIPLEEIGNLSLVSDNPVVFTTACAVFGESEAVSRVAEGLPKEDILAGVHKALAEKISSLVSRVRLEKECAISGGGGLNMGLIKWIEKKIGISLLVPQQPQFVTALGAAIIAANNHKK